MGLSPLEVCSFHCPCRTPREVLKHTSFRACVINLDPGDTLVLWMVLSLSKVFTEAVSSVCLKKHCVVGSIKYTYF